MAKKKRKSSSRANGKAADAVDSDIAVDGSDDEGSDLALDMDVVPGDDGEVVETAPLDLSTAPNQRLATKRRLDAYLERKWFRENGWDDDDDLFKDEFFDG